MTRKGKQIFVAIALVALLAFAAMPIYSKYRYMRAVTHSLQHRAKALADNNPLLRPAWDKAMQDGVLSRAEARAILEAAGESVGPEE